MNRIRCPRVTLAVALAAACASASVAAATENKESIDAIDPAAAASAAVTTTATAQSGAQPQLASADPAQGGATSPATNPVPADAAAVADVETPPSSDETGQSRMDESFGERTHAEWVRETRRQAFADTKYDVVVRSYYLNRDKYDLSESEAWALGGWAGLKTGYFRERFAFGLTGYTSQPAAAPDDKDGTLLLAPGQDGYTVLGEVYAEFLVNEKTRITAGRFGFDTPYINRNDSRMTPNTFEALLLQGIAGGGEGEAVWRFGGGYIDEIKERNSDEFISMAQDAGAPDGVDEGVYAAGLNWKKGNFSIGAIDYYSQDIINIFYTEAKLTVPLENEKLKLSFAAQYGDQTSVGDELLKGDFSANHWGLKSELGWGGALFTVAYTSAGGDSNINSPWSGYPGYNSVQVEDFNRDGEDAWTLRAGYNFQTVKGLGIYGLWVNGTDPDDPAQYARDEYNMNLQWSPPEGVLKGLMVRLRYSLVEQHDPMESELDDFRFMVFYSPPSL